MISKRKSAGGRQQGNTVAAKALPVRIFALLASSALCGVPALAGDALPAGGAVAAGAATISSGGGAMTVTQSSDRAVVNWQSFDVGEHNSVNFVQPGADSAILNRITGRTGSTIAGTLTANGQVFLVNPNGIAITNTGTVRAGGGFAASTLDIADDDFMGGRLHFAGNGSSATVSNEGVITIGRGGYAALMGGRVKNAGLIAVPYGKAGLGAGEDITLDLSGDGFMQVAVPSAPDGNDDPLIDNSGTVSAEGGVIVMQAATAREAARNAVNMTGVAEARSVSGHNGRIVLGGGAGGTVKVSGKVSTRAKKTAAAPAGGKGGEIRITGLEVALDDAALDAAGFAGGGVIRVGGDYQGTGTLQRAETLTVTRGTAINADALETGDGGSVVLWSDANTDFAGMISAKGATGRGGDAEVSGKALLAYTGFADLSGAAGFGTLLLDPYNITISDGPAVNASGLTATGDDSVIDVATLTGQLAGANVEIRTGTDGNQVGNITVASDIAWSADTTLTLTAASAIAFDADVTATGQSAGLVLNYGSDYAIADGKAITLSGANAKLAVNGASYTLVHSLAGLEAINSGLSGRYALAGDIDASVKAYTASVIGSFTGSFTGLGHAISGLTINATGSNKAALFNEVRNGFVRDLGVEGVELRSERSAAGIAATLSNATLAHVRVSGTVSADYSTAGVAGYLSGNSIIDDARADVIVTGISDYLGGIVGYAEFGSKLSNVRASGSVTGVQNIGGVAGFFVGTMTDSFSDAEVSGYSYVGGLIGKASGTLSGLKASGTVSASGSYVGGLIGNASGSLSDSYATGDVTVSYEGTQVGGLVGSTSSETIRNVYATGSVKGFSQVGGLVGYTSRTTISGAYATGDVEARDHAGGGFVGASYESTLSASYATGDVAGGVSLGGFIGATSRDDVVTTSWASGKVSGSRQIGGFAGENQLGAISDSYATGSVTGTATVGGFVGLSGNSTNSSSGGTIATSWSSGLVTGEGSEVGGFAGKNQTYGGISSSYFDSQTSGMTVGVGYDRNAGTTLTGLETADARSTAPYAGFDFTGVWYQAGDMRPILRAEANAAVDGVITINNLHQLALMGANLGASYVLANDIDASATDASAQDYDAAGIWGPSGWVPVGAINTSADAFNGTFDGDGHVISNLTADIQSARLGGLFGAIGTTGYVHDIGLAAANIVTNGYVGALAGTNSGTIANAYSDGNRAEGRSNFFGGLVGVNFGKISGSYTTGSVRSSGDYVGGLVGENGQNGIITQSYSTASVEGVGNVGGLVGRAYNGSSISQSFASGNVTGTGQRVGGLAGSMSSASITNTYATGSVSGINYVGGLVGYASGSESAISYSYTTGTVEGQGFSGAFMGAGAVVVTGDYYNTDNAGTLSAVGLGPGEGLTGLSTAEFQDTDGFYSLASQAGWDFENVWAPPSEGYTPELYALADVLFVEVGGISVTYGDGLSGAPAYSGIYGGNGADLSGFNPVLQSDVTAASNVGTYAVTGSQARYDADGVTYRVVYGGGVVTVGKATLTVTAGDDSMTYGDSAPGDIGYTATGWKNNQTSDLLSGVTVKTDATSTSNAGDGYATTASGGTLSGAALGNYDISYVDGAFTVDKATLTVTAGNGSMTYGDSAPDNIGYTATGWKNNQTSGLLSGVTVKTDATSTSNAGDGYATTASGGTLSGAALGNYAISYFDGAFTVDKATLTVTASNGSMIYGETPSGLGYSVSGWRNGQDGSLISDVAVVTDATALSNVGDDYTTIASGGTLSGAAFGNYTLAYVAGDFTVKQRALTIAAGNQSKTYGDAANLDQQAYTVSGLVNGDTIYKATVGSDGSDAAANAGEYDIDVTGVGIRRDANGGNIAGNYAIAVDPGTLTVGKAVLTITAGDGSMIYGDAPPTGIGYAATGWKNGQSSDLISGVTVTPSATAISNAGTGYVTTASGGELSGDAAGNYSFDFVNGDFEVKKAFLTVTAGDGSMVYGDTPSGLGYSVSGWKNGQDDGLLSGVTVSASAGALSNVGADYTTDADLGAALLSGAASGNYELGAVSGRFSVTQRALTVTAVDRSKTYGDAISLAGGYVVDGLVNGDTVDQATVSSAGADATADAGLYDILLSAIGIHRGQNGDDLAGNYAISTVDGALTVGKALLTITANDGAMVYGDAAPADIGYAATGWKNGQDGGLLSGVTVATDATSTSSVGSGYATTAAGGALSGAAAGNYDVVYREGGFEVTRRAITLTAVSATKTYGDSVALGYSVGGGGLVNGDTLSGTLASDGTAATAGVGRYAIGQGSIVDANNGNYAITYQDGALVTVTPRAITVAADSLKKDYGRETGLPYAIVAGNLVNGDRLSGDLFSAGSGRNANVGFYPILEGTLTDAANPDYAITFVPGTLEVVMIPSGAEAGTLPAAQGYGPGFVPYFTGGFPTFGAPDALVTTDDPELQRLLCAIDGNAIIACTN